MAADSSAYQHALGKSFNDLPPVLRRFTGAGKASYSGTCTVTRGSTGWSRFVGLLMGLPRKMHEAAFALDVDHAPHRCIWIRRFPNRKTLKTTIKSGAQPGACVMVESVGAATLTFQVTLDEDRLLLISQRGRFLGLPLPGFMAPRTEASIGCDGESILVESTVTMGRRSRLMRYTFEVTEAAAAAEPVKEKPPAKEEEDTIPADKALAEKGAADQTPSDKTQAPALPAGDVLTVSQKVPRPADADARTVPISKVDERRLRADLEPRTVEMDTVEPDGASPDADEADDADDATAVLGRPPVETAPESAEAPDSAKDNQESESQRHARPLDADRATVPVSASKVRRTPRKDDD